MRYVGKNFFTAVITIDPSSQNSLTNAVTLSNMINQNLPVRVGFVLLPKPGIAENIVKVAKFFDSQRRGKAVLTFLTSVCDICYCAAHGVCCFGPVG